MRGILIALTLLGCAEPPPAEVERPHCLELQRLGDKCCGLGFPDACGQVSYDFTDARCNESLNKVKGLCKNFSCGFQDEQCFSSSGSPTDTVSGWQEDVHDSTDTGSCDWEAEVTDPMLQGVKSTCKAYCQFLTVCNLFYLTTEAPACCTGDCFQRITPGGNVDAAKEAETKCFVKSFQAFQNTPQVCTGYLDLCGSLP